MNDIEIEHKRLRSLQRNPQIILWLKVLVNIKMINIVFSSFYLHRGITLSEIVWLPVIFAIANFSSEIFSSCFADTYGRKRILILAILCYLAYWVIYIQVGSFLLFCFGTVFYAVSCALFSGTDEALLYDSIEESCTRTACKKDEIEKQYKKYNGWFHAARRYPKIISPIIGVLLAKTLTEAAYVPLMYIDIAASVLALILVFKLVEAYPNKTTYCTTFKGLITSAVRIITQDNGLKKIALAKSLLMSSSFAVYSYYTVFFNEDLGVDILTFGFLWAIHHGVIVWFSIRISPKITQCVTWINKTYIIIFLLLVGFIGLWYARPEGNIFLAYLLYLLFCIIFTVRGFLSPLYSVMIQKKAASYNRATVISMTELVKGVTDVVVIGASALLLSLGSIYPYFVFAVCALVVALFLRLKEEV